MAANTKANEELQKLTKPEAEPDYLKSLANSASRSSTNSNFAAVLSQISEATIASIRDLAEMQIAVEQAKAEQELAQLREKQNVLKQQELSARTEGLTPMAIALGATHTASTPSPVSVRTRLSGSEMSHSNGLFPSSLNDLTAKAYNAPK